MYPNSLHRPDYRFSRGSTTQLEKTDRLHVGARINGV
jgi:hypothetical protein